MGWDDVKVTTNNNGSKEYEIKGDDGWSFVTNSESIARRESESSNRNYGSSRVSSGRSSKYMR